MKQTTQTTESLRTELTPESLKKELHGFRSMIDYIKDKFDQEACYKTWVAGNIEPDFTGHNLALEALEKLDGKTYQLISRINK
jgi:hypothetical protein